MQRSLSPRLQSAVFHSEAEDGGLLCTAKVIVEGISGGLVTAVLFSLKADAQRVLLEVFASLCDRLGMCSVCPPPSLASLSVRSLPAIAYSAGIHWSTGAHFLERSCAVRFLLQLSARNQRSRVR